MTASLYEFKSLLSKIERAKSVDELPAEIRYLNIAIEDKQNSRTFDCQVAQALVLLQQTVYRLAAIFIYGENATVNNLTSAELKEYKLSFSFCTGCTKVTIPITKIIASLAKSFAKEMNPTQKLVLVGLLGAVFVGAVSVPSALRYLDSSNQNELIKTAFTAINEAHKEISANFAKTVKGADALQVGAKVYSREEQETAQRKAPRTPIEWTMQTASFFVRAIDRTRPNTLSVTLEDGETHEVFRASGLMDEDAKDYLESLIHSLMNGDKILLTVNKGLNSEDNKIYKAVLLDVHESK